MFGIYGPLKKKVDFVFRTIFSKGEDSPLNLEYRATYPHILSNADELFADLYKNDKPNPAFKNLLRLNGKNSSSTARDSAYLLYYLSKIIKARVAIEVGVYRGAGSLHLAQALSENGGKELHLIDISADYLDDVQKKLAKNKFKIKIKSHCGFSDDRKILSGLPQADIIFIDADHTYDAVKQDFLNYWPLINEKGVLVLHDTVMWPGTRTFANELFTKGFPIITLATNGGAGISFIKKIVKNKGKK